jgi:aminoglycoside N3'-acetyltransferase
MNFNSYLAELGLHQSCNVIVHSSFKEIKKAFPQITPVEILNSLKLILTKSGSIIFPTFTYCFKKSIGNYEVFEPKNSKSKVGLLSETFRLSDGVKRTSSPTHSFAIWGKVLAEIMESNSPLSPLGKGSVLEWLTITPNSFVLMLGSDFSSLSYGHYLEIESKIPWYNFSPWEHLNVLEVGVSIQGEIELKEIPGCSKSFVNFEKYLIQTEVLKPFFYNSLKSYYINIQTLYEEGLKYFKDNYQSLLCLKGECKACDSRRNKFLNT